MSDFYTINRYALLIRPSKQMVAWINRLYPEDPVIYAEGMLDDNTDVYLIPELDDLDDAKLWLKDNYLAFLENTLDDWCSDRKLWPTPLDWATYERLIDYTIQANILDIVSEEEDEEYRDSDEEEGEGGVAAESDEMDWE